MTALTLVIGDKRYSSWSLRPWLALKQARLPFEEVLIPLRRPDTAARILERSPSGRVPVLVDGPLLVWESLAICEYVAELAGAVPLWPENRTARAVARAVATEMHSGFMGVRECLSMDLKPGRLAAHPTEAALADIRRIEALWADCRRRFGAGGDFLFGRWSIADAMYAPVAGRFQTYGIALSPLSHDYVAAAMALPAMQEWIAAIPD